MKARDERRRKELTRGLPEELKEQLLTPKERPEPPAELLERILEDIPDQLPVSRAADSSETPPGQPATGDNVLGRDRRWSWTDPRLQLLAASFLVLVAAGYVALRLGVPDRTAGAVGDFEPLAERPAEVAAAVRDGEAAPRSATSERTERSTQTASGEPSEPPGLKTGPAKAPLSLQDADQVAQMDDAAHAARPDGEIGGASTSRGAADDRPVAFEGLSDAGEDRSAARQLAAAGQSSGNERSAAPQSSLEKNERAKVGAAGRLASEAKEVELDTPARESGVRDPGRQREAFRAPEEAVAQRDEEQMKRDLGERREELRTEMERLRSELEALRRAQTATDAIVATSEAPASEPEPALAPPPPSAPKSIVVSETLAVPAGAESSVDVRRVRRASDWPPFQDRDPPDLEPARTNPFVDPEIDPQSTFGLDVDTASYTLVRRYLDEEQWPAPSRVRVEEMVNFFDYGDRPPRRGDFALTAEAAPPPFAASERIRWMRFSLRAREVDPHDRKPAVLTFVVDTSGSMRKNGRLEMVKQALGMLLDELRPSDRVALVTYNDRARTLLQPTADKERIRRAIAQLVPGGSTNLEGGLLEGYELASRGFDEGSINRVILASDGVANVGNTEAMTILENVADWAARGVELTAVGVGMGQYNDPLLERLADRGDGNYAYVDSLKEARRFFVENLTGTLQTVAADARVQVEFNPEVVAKYRLLGYENRDLPDEVFRNDNVDAGEIGAGHRVTVLYEVELEAGATQKRNAELARLVLRYRSKESGEMVEQEEPLRVHEIAERWERASDGFRFAVVVASFAEHLRRSPFALDTYDGLFREAQRLVPRFPGRTDVVELVSLIGDAAELERR